VVFRVLFSDLTKSYAGLEGRVFKGKNFFSSIFEIFQEFLEENIKIL